MAPPLVIYGIRTCDTVGKARAWLDAAGLAYRFHDFRADGLSSERLAQWLGQVGWEALLNRASATFRGLPSEDRAGLDEGKAARLMLTQPKLIKRPVLERGKAVMVGFKPERYQTFLAA
jgi:arsenate reductase